MENEKQRIYFLDNIKIFLTSLVIIHHAGQAYGPTGGFWEYRSSLGENIPFLGYFFSINAAFFMGFFFLISGYFMVMSFDKSNGVNFLKKRMIKLGIPLLFAFFVMMPLQRYSYYINYSGNTPLTFFEYYVNVWFGINGLPDDFSITLTFPELNFGHTWYIEHLLTYSIIYWIIRKLFKNSFIRNDNSVLSAWKILMFTMLVAISTAVAMIWYPFDEWIGFLGFFQVEAAHWPQYLILFIIGCIAYRKNWLFTLKTKTGYIFFFTASLMMLVHYSGIFTQFLWNIWGIYSSIFAVFIIFGMLALFREKLNRTSKFLNIMSRISYASYIIHYPIILLIQHALDKVSIGGAWGKFIIVSVLSMLMTYVIGYFLTRVKYVNRVL